VVDKASPGFHKAMCTGQNLKQAVLDFYRIDPAERQEQKYYTITLTNCRVVDIRPYMPMSFVPC
jgi:type VI secretion system Hcp family effector